MILRLRIVYFFIIIFNIFSLSCYSSPENPKNEVVRFLMVYETNKPLVLNKSVLYFSKTKWLTKKQDSVVLGWPAKLGTPDSITFDTTWKYPVYLTLKLYFSDRVLISNSFYFSSGNSSYEAFVRDTTIKVSPKLSNSFFTQSSLNGIVLVIQAILEMIIALLISKIFGLSRHVVLMVLAANIATFPLYMINISGFFVGELLVFTVKAIVMMLIGLRKIPIYKVLLLLAILTIISLGFKELFFFIVRLI